MLQILFCKIFFFDVNIKIVYPGKLRLSGLVRTRIGILMFYLLHSLVPGCQNFVFFFSIVTFLNIAPFI